MTLFASVPWLGARARSRLSGISIPGPGWWGLLACCLGCLTVRAQTNTTPKPSTLPEVTITTNFYVFRGTNHAQMRAAMREARPWKQSLPFDAQTKWEVHSSYRVSRDAGQFSLISVEVKTRVVITLPWWVPAQKVDRDLVARWQRYANSLAAHEHGHLQVAMAAGAAVKQRLLALEPARTPDALTALAARTANSTVEEYRDRERAYDQSTRHGFTQGAVFHMTPEEAREAFAADAASKRF